MKKVLFSIMLAAGISSLAFGQSSQSSQSQSSQSQSGSQKDRTLTMQNDKDQAGWVKIGEKTVDLDQDKGIFDWNTDREKTINANEKYSAIKFRTKDSNVNLTNVEVQYENGRKQDLTVNSPVMVGSDSKPLTLDQSQKLDKVTFGFAKGATAGEEDKAKVELWGLKANAAGRSGMGTSSDSASISLPTDDRINP
jgi:hypothetical protein